MVSNSSSLDNENTVKPIPSNVSMMKPGLLVALKTRVTGGIQYRREDLDASEVTKPDESAVVARWETVKITEDPAEHAAAVRTVNLASSNIRKHCAATAFGLLCPEDNEAQLDAAVVEARQIINKHNETAKHTYIYLYLIKGRIASTDEQAAKAIAEEVRSLLDTMNQGINKLDPKMIRDAVAKAKQMQTMLQPGQADTVAKALDAARKAARLIVNRVQKKGQDAAEFLKTLQRADLENARMAFLDTATEELGETVELPVQNEARFDLDLMTGDGRVSDEAQPLSLT